jgi:Ca2+-transporting ATPase
VEVSQLQIIEALLTGEPKPITKVTCALKGKKTSLGDRTNMAFMSTIVQKGRGRGIVVERFCLFCVCAGLHFFLPTLKWMSR